MAETSKRRLGAESLEPGSPPRFAAEGRAMPGLFHLLDLDAVVFTLVHVSVVYKFLREVHRLFLVVELVDLKFVGK
jgi:hypothetical protein